MSIYDGSDKERVDKVMSVIMISLEKLMKEID
jgi:hypothetical protein